MNIDEILAKHSPNYRVALENKRQRYCIVMGLEVKAAIKEIIEETLRLAFEKSRVEGNKGVLREEILVRDLEYEESYWITINKQSILDVIKQIEI